MISLNNICAALRSEFHYCKAMEILSEDADMRRIWHWKAECMQKALEIVRKSEGDA